MSDVLILVYYSFSLLRDGMTVYQTALGLQLLIKGYIHYRAYLFPHIIWLKKKIKGTEDIPSFLKTEKVLMNIRDFLEYSKTYNPYNGLFLRKELNAINRLLLDHYVDR